MTIEVTGSFTVNPLAVEYELGRAPFSYPSNREADPNQGWARFAVIPGLFGLMVSLQRFPTAPEGLAFLMRNCDPHVACQTPIRRRGEKLYLDFARDMHTFGLIQRAPLFGFAQYQKSLDLGFNVDYLACLLPQLVRPSSGDSGNVGVQAAMRADWRGLDRFEEVKKQRRARRGVREWDGPLYWLTNKHLPPAKRIAGCWLFGPAHIKELCGQIEADLGLRPEVPTMVAVQGRLEL